ncbi:dTDP-3,4-didehydro-2,6-dideoxy-alpha-D-glucose 3-reductase [Capsicum annuum]|uniref:dTDP-3,4-didehydro-2,6-dideoxy-alpha-D-glucose 3-reductase n=1 Tax=Capsicum annuum TaxID=4072 RepID=UPI0007BEBA19|nr:dTDP-3,4-didehydro-2,6-dideoxy-alpha-D-glucose 3-reductase [Capsicum annuum]
MAESQAPHIAIIGAGIFVKTQYIPRLAEIPNLFVLSAIWSRSEESARSAVEVAQKHFPNVVCKWGDAGLEEIIKDSSITGVAVVLAGQAMVDMSLRLLKAGKHVLQEKPAAETVEEAEKALAHYSSLSATLTHQPIWAVAENYRFEPAIIESKKLISEIGEMINIQVIIEGSMNSSNPYFASSWRRQFVGGFILDMGVHFVAGLRMLVGCEISSLSSMNSHVDKTLPPPDNISSIFQLENGCSGVFVMVVNSKSPKIMWRVVGLNGVLQVERGIKDGQHGYSVSLNMADGQSKSFFYQFSGVTDELKTFLSDVSTANLKKDQSSHIDPRLSFAESARDVAVLEAMLESGKRQGALVQVKKF